MRDASAPALRLRLLPLRLAVPGPVTVPVFRTGRQLNLKFLGPSPASASASASDFKFLQPQSYPGALRTVALAPQCSQSRRVAPAHWKQTAGAAGLGSGRARAPAPPGGPRWDAVRASAGSGRHTWH